MSVARISLSPWAQVDAVFLEQGRQTLVRLERNPGDLAQLFFQARHRVWPHGPVQSHVELVHFSLLSFDRFDLRKASLRLPHKVGEGRKFADQVRWKLSDGQGFHRHPNIVEAVILGLFGVKHLPILGAGVTGMDFQSEHAVDDKAPGCLEDFSPFQIPLELQHAERTEDRNKRQDCLRPGCVDLLLCCPNLPFSRHDGELSHVLAKSTTPTAEGAAQ